jgi:hypothetical protein
MTPCINRAGTISAQHIARKKSDRTRYNSIKVDS